MTPELKARQEIDRLLSAAGWHVCDMAQANIHAARGGAVREFPLALDDYADLTAQEIVDDPEAALERFRLIGGISRWTRNWRTASEGEDDAG